MTGNGSTPRSTFPARSARRVGVAAVVSVVAVLAVAVVGPSTGASATPVEPKRSVVVPAPARGAGLGGDLPPGLTRGAITTPQEVRRGIAVVGATWKAGELAADDVVEVRVRRGGVWQGWEAMEVDDAHAPDTTGSGADEARNARPGTAPYVAQGEQAQVRVVTGAAAVPSIEVDVIDPGTSPADATAGAPAPGAAAAAAARPTIIPRAEWGADESIRTGDPTYGQAQVAFVHHTAGSNSYSAAQVPGILRGIYEFHVNGRGWNDIGYQFLVDRYGRTWEGRYGGVDRAVVGAQAGGFNSGSFGASVLGDFTSSTPPAPVLTALEELIAWKFTLHGTPALGTVSVSDVVFERISGHRDANSTTCPGQRLYDRLPALRSAVAARMGSLPRSSLQRSVDLGDTPDVLTYAGSVSPPSATGPAQVLRSASPQPVVSGRRIGSGWQVLDHIVLTPDVTGDGHADVVALDPRRGALLVYRGDGRGGFAGVDARGGGWNVMTRLVAAGDRTGDGRADLLAVREDGALILYPGDGKGWVTAGHVIATGFAVMGSVVAAGDVTGDGRPDLVASRPSNGRLYLYPGTAGGGVAPRLVWGGGWQKLDQLVSGIDADGDGRPGDITTRQADGRMRSYYADETGRLTRVNTWGGGWGGLDELSSGADWTGDGIPDVLGRARSSGDLRLYAGTGERDFSAPALPVLTGLAGADLVRVVGDLDGDGLSDGIARMPGGDLIGLRGRGDGRFDRLPTRIGAGWEVFDLVEPVGDYSNDGVPDLLARTTTGELRLYTMTRSIGFGWSIVVGNDWAGARSITGAGAVTSDPSADVVVLRDDGTIRLYRGSGPGGLNHYDVVLTGQDDLTQLLGVGDYSGDGAADLLGRSRDGALWLYTGNGKGSFSPARQPVRSDTEVADVLG